MKVARIHDYGAASVLDEAQTPDIGPDEVLVRVKAASLNPVDVKLHSGAMRDFFPLAFPYTLGTDLAGTVERAGPRVARWRQGDKVVARLDPTRGGALADFAVVPAAHVAAAPARVSLEEAAGVPTAAGTAWQALFETASGSGVEPARQLGADQVIAYRSENFSEAVSDADLVLDTVGGETQQRSFDVLRSGGTLIATTSPPDETLADAHNVKAAFVFHRSDGSRLGLLLGLLDAGTLKVPVDRKVPLEELGDTFQHQGSGRVRGKIILSVN